MVDSITAPVDLRGLPHPCTFRPGASGNRLVVCLPGRAYRANMPVLHYSLRALNAAGADTVSIDYAYDTDPGFQGLSDAEVDARLSRDVGAVVDRVLSQRTYS